MTNLEAIKAYSLLNYPVDENTYSLHLINVGISPTDEYSKENQKDLELCVSDLILMLISSAKSISDDGYSVTMQDVPNLWKLRTFYRSKWELEDDTPNDKPILKDGSFKW